MKNKTVRRLITFIVAVTAAATLSACGTTEKKVETEAVTEAAVTETEAVTEEAVTETEAVTEEAVTETEAVTEEAVTETEAATEETAAETEAATEETVAETEAATEETAAETEKATEEAVTETEAAGADTEEETVNVTDAEDTSVLTADEEELIALLAEDTTVITDDMYAELVSEMQYHAGEFTGKVYQMEGVYTTEHQGETPYIFRTLVNGEEETFCGLPLVYSDKDIKEGTWVKATGIVNMHEIEGEDQVAFEIMAIQSVEEPGNEVLEWSGSAHAH